MFYWTAFGFANEDPESWHCTHKFLGTQSQSNVEEIRSLIDDYFAANPFKKFKVRFDRPENFGTEKNIKVLCCDVDQSKFYPDLKSKLDKYRKDDFCEYQPHITPPEDSTSVEVVDNFFDTYYLMGRGVIQKWP